MADQASQCLYSINLQVFLNTYMRVRIACTQANISNSQCLIIERKLVAYYWIKSLTSSGLRCPLNFGKLKDC